MRVITVHQRQTDRQTDGRTSDRQLIMAIPRTATLRTVKTLAVDHRYMVMTIACTGKQILRKYFPQMQTAGNH